MNVSRCRSVVSPKLGEPLLERHREQEREQHLHARQGDADLVEELDQLPVDPLFVRLLRHSGGEY
jgi:hypothetical protein